MSNINKNKYESFKKIDRDALFREFLMPFDQIFDDIIKNNIKPNSQYSSLFEKGSYPKVDIFNGGDFIRIEAAIPGMTKEEVSVEIYEGMLTISGNKNENLKEETGSYLCRELKRSSFRRSWVLPDNLDEENVTAKFENGMLYLKFPKKVIEPKKKARQIEIK